MLLANARLYAVTPAARTGWEALFGWLARETGAPVQAYDHPAPVPMEALWRRPDLGCALMCGWPFARREPRPQLLAAPVPTPERYGGEPRYFTDLVVRRDSSFARLEDTFGGSVGWTIEDSHSGFNAPRHHLLAYRTAERPSLYGRSVGGLFNPIGSLRAVAGGTVDVAPVDSFCHDLLRAAGHPLTDAVRIVATTAASPIPPLVASAEVDPGLAAALRAALLGAHAASELAEAFRGMMVACFIAVPPERYAVARAREEAAVAAGYAAPA